MKFIHTADWHLGNSLFDIDRTEEFEQFLSWLTQEVKKVKANALVIAGDVFDVANPPITSRKQYNNFLASLIQTNCKNVIIVGGNHDSSALLDSEKEIIDVLNIHVVGSLSSVKPEDMIFEITDETGNVIGVCCAVPYAREIELRKYYPEKSSEGDLSDFAYTELYKQVLDAAKIKKNNATIPIIATGHLYASGLEGRFENQEQEIRGDDGRRTIDDVIGNLGSVHISSFPDDFDYIALGHIHYTTMVCKNTKIRYSGSPFVLGFDEANLPRYVLCVDVNPGTDPVVEKIEVPQFFTYRRIAGSSIEIKKELEKYIPKAPINPTYLEAYYVRENGLNIYDALEETVKKLPHNVAIVNRKPQPFTQSNTNNFKELDPDEVKNLDPNQIFTSLILAKCPITTDNLTEEQVTKEQEKLINRYLPLFKEVAKEIEDEIAVQAE